MKFTFNSRLISLPLIISLTYPMINGRIPICSSLELHLLVSFSPTYPQHFHSSSALNSTEPPPTIPPPKPNSEFSSTFNYFCSADYSCGCELTNGKAEFASSIWMDIIFIVDVSKAMGNDGIAKVQNSPFFSH